MEVLTSQQRMEDKVWDAVESLISQQTALKLVKCLHFLCKLQYL